MAGGWRRGWILIISSFRIFKKYPIFVIPIILVWVVYAPTIIYMKYFFPYHNFNTLAIWGIIFSIVVIFSLNSLTSCAIVLELIQQLERGKELSLAKACRETITKNFIKIVPIALIWAIIWFILGVIDAFLSRSKEKIEFNAMNVAKTLAEYERIPLSVAFIRALHKGVRMIVFLIIPAIAWEDLSFTYAIKKGLGVLKSHLAEFASGYTLTYFAAGIIFLPPAILFELGTGSHGNPPLIVFPESLWMWVTIYIGFAWSFCIYLEQMFTANLYLWHLKWEKAIKVAKIQGKPLPEFKDISQPSLLDNIPDLV